MAFIKFILILLLIYYGIKIIMRFYGPQIMQWMTKKMMNKVEKRFRESASNMNPNQPNPFKSKKPLDTSKSQAQKSKTKDPVGEYIDFEEIE